MSPENLADEEKLIKYEDNLIKSKITSSFSFFRISIYILIILPCLIFCVLFGYFITESYMKGPVSSLRPSLPLKSRDSIYNKFVNRENLSLKSSLSNKYRDRIYNNFVNRKNYERINRHHFAPFYVRYNLKPNTDKIPKSFECDNKPNHLKFDCYPDDLSVTKEKCVQRGCCWHPISYLQNQSDDINNIRDKPAPNIPYCYYPQDYPQYTLINEHTPSEYRFIGNISRTRGPSFAPNNTNDLVVDIMVETTQRLRIKIYDPKNPRYEVPYPKMPPFVEPNSTDVQYRILINADPFYFIVSRYGTNTVLFDSSVGVFIFADQFIQFSAKLSSPYIYGLGEQHDSFMHNIYWSRYTLFNHDTPPRDYNNLYGSHAFYLNMEESGKANGVFLFNSNAMDVTLQPTPAITYRTIGGILDFYFFLGPTPADVISQYNELIGRPFLPPYWSLGFHLCRYNYNSLNNTKMIWQRNRDASIPFDTQWNDIDYMDNHKDFSYNNKSYYGLDKFVDELHNIGMHYMVIIDPGISASESPGSYEPYDEGIQQGVFIKGLDGKPFEGKVWTDGSTVWVDFFNPNATGYWTKQFKKLHDQIKIDGAWIDMNEPANFQDGSAKGCPNTSLDYPFFTPDVESGFLFYHTICMSAKQYGYDHYNVHNLYGLTESISTYSALSSVLEPRRRPFIISRSSAPGLGKYSGHWTGDIDSTYKEMQRSIPGILNFNMFGISMIGADICGFQGNTTQELCQRWMELGAFYPFSRNHNDKDYIDQDPAAFGGAIINSSRVALAARYSLLPYLYTLFYRSNLYGETVARALFFEFPQDKLTYYIDEQFLWGPALLISPVLYQGLTEIKPYFPKAVWYDFWTGEALPSTGTFVPLTTPLEKINLHVRGGYVLPMQKPEVTTTASRTNVFWLLVALSENKTASGQLIWDHGDQTDTWDKEANNILFNVANSKLQSQVKMYNYQQPMILGNVTILGIEASPSHVTVNTNDVPFTYVADTMVLYVTNFAVPLSVTFSLQWYL